MTPSAPSAPPPPVPTPARCPGCGAPLVGAPLCEGCGLPLTGPVAARLWDIDVELLRLEGVRAPLLAERARLLAALRAAARGALAAGGAAGAAAAGGAAAGAVASVFAPGSTGSARQEWTPQRVQNLLLVLGGVLLAVAAAVFAAVSYDRLGAGGRALVLLALTAGAATAAPRLRARGLVATAETVAAVALALAVLEAWALRRAGLGAGLSGLSFAATTSALLAGGCAAYAAVVPLRLPRLAAVVLANAAPLLLVPRVEGALAASLLLAAIAAADLTAIGWVQNQERTPARRDVLGALVVLAAGVTGLAVLAALAAVGSGPSGSVALVACAAVVAAAAVLAEAAVRGWLRTALVAGAVGLAVLAVPAAAVDRLSPASVPPVVAAAGVIAMALAVLLPRVYRRGVLLGSAVASVGAVAAILEAVVAGLAGPFGWVLDPWSLPAGSSARSALAPLAVWDGGWAAPVTLLLAAAGAGVAHRALGARGGDVVAGGLALPALLLLPLALDLPHPAAVLALLVLAGLVLAVTEAVAERPRTAAAGLAAAVATAVLAGAWALADQGVTLAVLPLVGLLLAAAATRPALAAAAAVTTGLSGLAFGAELAASGAAAGLATEQVGGLLLLAPAALLALAAVLPPRHRLGAEVAGALLAGAAVALAASDPGWLSWTLAGCALLALATALRGSRRTLAPVGALLLTASSWVRLAQADVSAPEPYVLPLAALALLLGHLRFRRDRSVRSQAVYGPGLVLLLVPSLLAALVDDDLTRPLLVGAAALAVLLIGAHSRLQAPLVIGSGVLAVVALDLLAPYAAALPRWTALGTAGTLLVVVGATFEQRRREVLALRDRVAGMR